MSIIGSSAWMRLTAAAAALVLAAWSPAAIALPATVVSVAHLRAGPSIEYPSVAIMPAGAVVELFGCEAGYNWCDVQIGPDRGWVDAVFLQMTSPGGPVIVASNPVVVGVPIVTFVFDAYWGNYYVGRPWYGRRGYYHDYWNRYPQGRPPPIYRPPVVRPPPPVRPPRPVRPPPRPPGKPPGTVRPPPTPGQGKPPVGGKPPDNGRPPKNDNPAEAPKQ
jgi:uncharacterized protein YraI